MLIRRTAKFKLKATKKQTEKLSLYLEKYAFVYNGYLQLNIHTFQKTNRFLSAREMFLMLSKLKNKFPDLKKLPSKFFEFVIIHLAHELSLVKNDTFPTPMRGNNDMFFVTSSFIIDQENNRVSFKGMDPIKFFNSKEITGNIRNISFLDKNGTWFLYIYYEYYVEQSKRTPASFIGIDVGLKEFAILSNGKKITNPRYYRQLEAKLAIEQRKLFRKEKDSENWKKQRKKVQKVYQQIVDYRMNFLHKTSSYLVERYDVIGIEKLSIQTMVKNKKYSKSILDAGWGTFIQMLKYKAEEKNKIVIEVERFYPSSQLCSSCGSKQFMPLHLRTYVCKRCQAKIDRDYNASLNIEKRAKEIYFG